MSHMSKDIMKKGGLFLMPNVNNRVPHKSSTPKDKVHWRKHSKSTDKIKRTDMKQLNVYEAGDDVPEQ